MVKIDMDSIKQLSVAERVPLVITPPNAACKRYLQVKKDKLGHLLPDFE